MRVCFISRRFFPTISGMSVYAVNLLRELVRSGVDVTMISQYRGDELGKRVYGGGPPCEVAGVKTIGLESVGEQAGGDFELDIARIVETVLAEHRAEPFDLIHAQYGYPPGLAAIEAGRMIGVPSIVSIQGGDGHWVGVGCCETHRAAMRTVLACANRVLIGSRSFADEVRVNHDADVSGFTIVPGAVDTERFRPRHDWSAGEFIDDSAPRILYHGRVDRRKGALDLIDAFAALPHSSTPYVLQISGIGPDSEAVQERVKILDLASCVRVTGYAGYETVPEIYRGADVFVSPTYAEGFSNTILEAMASGLPVISTRAVGVVDCVRDRENGMLVEPGSVEQLCDAMAEVLTDFTLREKLAVNALNECRKTYSWTTIGRQIVDIYLETIGQEPNRDWVIPAQSEPCRYRDAPHLL